MVGAQSKWRYLLRVTVGNLNMAAAGVWTRNQGAHAAAYGVKVDVKTLDHKRYRAKETLFGALRVRQAAVDAQKAADLTLVSQAVFLLDHRISSGAPAGIPSSLTLPVSEAVFGSAMV